jgi:hypothetical protein
MSMNILAEIFLEAVPMNEYKRAGQQPLFCFAVLMCLVTLLGMLIARLCHII